MIDMSKIKFKLSMIGLLDILGGLDNARLRPSDTADKDSFDLPPILVWNYLEEDPEVIKLIEKSVKEYPWQDPWTFEKVRNKWALYPKKIKEINDKFKFSDNINDDSFEWLRENEPEFGQRTNKDLHKFTEYFEKIVREYMENKSKDNS